MAGTSATLLARKWESALLVNVDNDTLRRIMDNPEAMAAVERIEGWRALGDNTIETINKSEKVKKLKNKAKEGNLTAKIVEEFRLFKPEAFERWRNGTRPRVPSGMASSKVSRFCITTCTWTPGS